METKMKTDCPNRAETINGCPCKRLECERRAICCQCVARHRKTGSPVACMRPDAMEASRRN